jgi:DNA-binding CsgD family transcriptional regulator
MRFRSRRTLITTAAAAAAISLVAGGATAFAQSGSGSSGSAPPEPRTEVALLGPVGIAGPAGAIKDCGPVSADGPAAAAASYLGLTPEEIKTQLGAGKSLADIAAAQGKSVDGLKQAMLDAAKADLDRQVANGDITADEEQSILTKLRQGIDDFVSGKGGLAVKVVAKGGTPALFGDEPFTTAADYLGLSVDQLTGELRAGKSLAEIATAQGKSVSGLKQTLVDAATKDIEQAVDKLVNQKGLPEPRCAEEDASVSAPEAH